jgi:hypothetical protein
MTLPQAALIVVGCGLLLSSVFIDRLAAAWEGFLYPNAVRWQDMRIVPDENQKIVMPGENVLVIRQGGGLLTLFMRPDDELTPQAMVGELCRRDGCARSTIAGDGADRAAATYKLRGTSMQIVLMRLGDGELWGEYRGAPGGLDAFDNVLDSVSEQLAERRDAAE